MSGLAAPFGARLAALSEERGPLCVGVDPHPGLLAAWGLDDDVAGLERFALTVVEELAGEVAALKPQAAFFERFGSRGVAVLERVVAGCADGGALCVVDAKRGDIGSTMAAYADAFAGDGSPLAGDAVTASPFLGVGSLDPLLDRAAETGRGVFVLALTSNPEGASVQLARDGDGRTVAEGVLRQLATRNTGARERGLAGSVGVVVGATVREAAAQFDLPGLLAELNGPVLAPGIGAQGATAADLRAVFGAALPQVLASSSREVLGAGAGNLSGAAARTLDSLRALTA